MSDTHFELLMQARIMLRTIEQYALNSEHDKMSQMDLDRNADLCQMYDGITLLKHNLVAGQQIYEWRIRDGIKDKNINVLLIHQHDPTLFFRGLGALQTQFPKRILIRKLKVTQFKPVIIKFGFKLSS